MDYDSSDLPSAYDQGREISLEKKQQVLKFFLENLSINKIRDIVDLGCGTGRFTGVLAELFDANVIGIDPSAKMLNQANAKYRTNNFSFQQASGEQLPIAESSVDMIFMSMVLHHLDDIEKTISECKRILRSGGVVCIRSTFTEEISTYPYLDLFPSIRSIIASQLISREKLIRLFCSNEIKVLAHQTSWGQIASDWQAFANKMALRADSFVARLDDDEFEAGLKEIQTNSKTTEGKNPVGLNVDSFVFIKQ